MKINSEYGKIILRISLSLVFLWFGINQIYSPLEWVGFIPNFLSQIISAKTLIILNGSFEIIFGLMMLTGLYLRIVSLFLSLHLISIALSLGYSALLVRDLGLAFAVLATLFLGPDKWCLDKKNEN